MDADAIIAAHAQKTIERMNCDQARQLYQQAQRQGFIGRRA
jgi:hypothetical protein